MGFMITTLLAYLLYILLDCPFNNLIKIIEEKNTNKLINPNIEKNIDLNNNNIISFVGNKDFINKYTECTKF
jgi:hypothetical protein